MMYEGDYRPGPVGSVDTLGQNPGWQQFRNDMSTYDSTGTVRNVDYSTFTPDYEAVQEINNILSNRIHDIFRQRRLGRSLRYLDPNFTVELDEQVRLRQNALERERAALEMLRRRDAPMTGVRPGNISLTEEMIARTDPTMLRRRVRPEPLNMEGTGGGFDPGLLEGRQALTERSGRYRSNVIPDLANIAPNVAQRIISQANQQSEARLRALQPSRRRRRSDGNAGPPARRARRG